MKIKTNELTGAALDWATGKAWGLDIYVSTFGPLLGKGYKWACVRSRKYHPSTDPKDFYLLQEKFRYEVVLENDQWKSGKYTAPTIGEVICKRFVAHRFGDEVEVPKELL